jgi:chromosomal replication initiator protein
MMFNSWAERKNQEEFFPPQPLRIHRQIVITSDKLPKIPDGGKTPLASAGVDCRHSTSDIEPRPFSARKRNFQYFLSNEVGLFLASNLGTNVRSWKGAPACGHILPTGSDINEAMARETLKDILIDRQKMISIENIQKTYSFTIFRL